MRIVNKLNKETSTFGKILGLAVISFNVFLLNNLSKLPKNNKNNNLRDLAKTQEEEIEENNITDSELETNTPTVEINTPTVEINTLNTNQLKEVELTKNNKQNTILSKLMKHKNNILKLISASATLFASVKVAKKLKKSINMSRNTRHLNDVDPALMGSTVGRRNTDNVLFPSTRPLPLPTRKSPRRGSISYFSQEELASILDRQMKKAAADRMEANRNSFNARNPQNRLQRATSFIAPIVPNTLPLSTISIHDDHDAIAHIGSQPLLTAQQLTQQGSFLKARINKRFGLMSKVESFIKNAKEETRDSLINTKNNAKRLLRKIKDFF